MCGICHDCSRKSDGNNAVNVSQDFRLLSICPMLFCFRLFHFRFKSFLHTELECDFNQNLFKLLSAMCFYDKLIVLCHMRTHGCGTGCLARGVIACKIVANLVHSRACLYSDTCSIMCKYKFNVIWKFVYDVGYASLLFFVITSWPLNATEASPSSWLTLAVSELSQTANEESRLRGLSSEVPELLQYACSLDH